MNQLRQPGPTFPQWNNNLPNNIRNNFQDNNNQFYRAKVPQPYLAPRGNDFVRYTFQQPLLPLPPQQARPVYNNAAPWSRSQANTVTRAPYPMSQPRFEEFNLGRENFCPPGGAPLIIQSHPGNFQPVFSSPSVQTRFLVPFIPGNQTRQPLLPLPSNFVRGNVNSRQTTPIPAYNMCQQVDNNNNAPLVNPPNGFVQHQTNGFHNGTRVGFKPNEIDGIERKTFQTPNGTMDLRENKYQQRLLAFPQLPPAAHDFLNYMDEDAEILAYFEAEIQLYFNNTLILETGVHVVLTKPSELSLTWILAFVKYVFNESDGNLLRYNRAINRFISLTMVNSCTLSLESDEHRGEYAILKFRNTQESQRFQGLFHSHKSELVRDKKRVYNNSNWQNLPSESVDSSNSNLAPSERATKPIAWITKLPPEIAQFHGSSAEKSPVPKKIRSCDEFIYDSSTFHNALHMNSSINDKEGGNKDSLEFSFFDSTGETKDCDIKRDDDIMFMARNICLLMKSDRASNDYRSPGFGNLIIVSNSNYYNYLEFTDSSNVLKCRHYIDNQNRVERNYPSGDDDCCTWEAFAEIYNAGPNNRRGVMNFKISLPTVDLACRFEKVMSDSIKKAIGKGPAGTWQKKETFYDTEDRDYDF